MICMKITDASWLASVIFMFLSSRSKDMWHKRKSAVQKLVEYQTKQEEGYTVKKIEYIKQPTEYLCGQACVAMLAGVSVEDVVAVMENDKGTGKKDIEKALRHYGISQAKTMTKADNNTVLPKVCILKVLLPKYGHWILYYDGKYYDPEFGLTDTLYPKARIQYYLKIFIDEE